MRLTARCPSGVNFNDNFRVAGGLLASIQKGSNFRFDQALVSDGLWLPTGGEGTMQARLLMVKNVRQHFVSTTSTTSASAWRRNKQRRQSYAEKSR